MNFHPIQICSLLVICVGHISTLPSDSDAPDSVIRPLRLPPNFVPEHYKLDVATYFDDDHEPNQFTFTGRVWIKIRCRHDARQIILHARGLVIDSAGVTVDELSAHGPRRRTIEVHRVELDERNSFLIVHLNDTMTRRFLYELHIPFENSLDEELFGYYRSNYFDSKLNRTLWMSVTQFESIHARAAFPCFDEPAFKARFEVSLGHRSKYTALSNMPLRSSERNSSSDWTWDHFEMSIPMSTYLVAYSVHQFEHRATDPYATNGVTYRVWSRPDYIDQVDYALWFAPRAVQFFETYFELDYPISKFDLIAVPDFEAAAMENYGLVTFSEDSLLYALGKTSLLDQQSVASVIAHEAAHMWFGNLVTVKWWSDIWLNEGLSTYMGAICVAHIHPEWDHDHISSMQNILISLRLDGRAASRAIGGAEEMGTFEEIENQFAGGAYEKGATIVRMLQHVLGEEAFRDGIRNYLRTHRYGNVVQDDFVQSLQGGRWRRGDDDAGRIASIGIPLTDIMDTWLLQPGYPIIYVERNYANQSVSITQRRFFNFKDDEPPIANDGEDDDDDRHAAACWWIPLSYITRPTAPTIATHSDQSKSPKTTMPNWLKCDNRNVSFVTSSDSTFTANVAATPSAPIRANTTATSVDSDSIFVYRHPDEAAPTEWVLHNIEMAGLYRVRYDTHNWMLLIEHLAGPHFRRISPINRAQLIDDAMSEAWFGRLSYGRAMRLMAYLSQEDDYVPWSMALDNLDMLSEELDGTALHELFKDFMRTILTPIYQRVGGLTWGADSHKLNIHLKTLIIQYGCMYEVEDCRARAVAYFQQWMASRDADKINRIPLDLRATVYCTALRVGGAAERKFLQKRYKHSRSVHERYEMQNADGCARGQRNVAGHTMQSVLSFGARRRRRFGDTRIVFERSTSAAKDILAENDPSDRFNNTPEYERDRNHWSLWSKFRPNRRRGKTITSKNPSFGRSYNQMKLFLMQFNNK